MKVFFNFKLLNNKEICLIYTEYIQSIAFMLDQFHKILHFALYLCNKITCKSQLYQAEAKCGIPVLSLLHINACKICGLTSEETLH